MQILGRVVCGVTLVTMVVGMAVLAGCDRGLQKGNFKETEKFVGQLVQNGNPVTFADDEDVQFDVIYLEKAQRFGIPIKPDGSFEIKWMPTGKYNATLTRNKKGGSKTGPKMYNVPDFSIEQGQTEYKIELGKGYKP